MNARLTFIAFALAAIGLGLIVHRYGGALGSTARDVVGDILWASMIAWWIGAIVPGTSLHTRVVVAIAICFAAEASQLYHTPTLDAVRGTTIGQLTLGSGFDPRDLIAYTLGVLLAALLERTRRTGHRG
jgi:hypothetical protein